MYQLSGLQSFATRLTKGYKCSVELCLATNASAGVIKKQLQLSTGGPSHKQLVHGYFYDSIRSAVISSLVVLLTASLLSLESTGGTSLVNGCWCELDMLLGGDSDHEGWDVNKLLSDGDVSLSDEDSGMVQGFG